MGVNILTTEELFGKKNILTTEELLVEEKKKVFTTEELFKPEVVTQPTTAPTDLGLPSGQQSTPEMKPIISGLPMSIPEDKPTPLEKIGYTASVFGEAITNIPKSIKASFLQTQGWEGVSVVAPDKNDQYINEFEKEQAEVAKEAISKYGDMSFMGVKLSDVANMPQNIGYSAVSMAGGVAGAAPFIWDAPLALAVGTTASGAVAFKMSTYQIMKSYLDIKNEESISIKGRPITLEEENNLKKDFADKARKYGLWEAIPEALSNFAFFSILTAPLTKMVGKTIAGKIVNKVGGLYGEELLTETITQMGQANIQAEAGMGGEKRDLLSASDWWKSFREVAPQTALLTTVMAGAGTSIIETSKAINKARVSLSKEIGADNPLYNDLEKKVMEKIKEETKAPETKTEIPITPEVTPETPKVSPVIEEKPKTTIPKELEGLAEEGITVYHGTTEQGDLYFGKSKNKNNQIPIGVHFTTDRNMAEDFASGVTKGKTIDQKGIVKEYKLNTKNAFDISKPGLYQEGSKEYNVLKEIGEKSNVEDLINLYSPKIGYNIFENQKQLYPDVINSINPNRALSKATPEIVIPILKKYGYAPVIKYAMKGTVDPMGMGMPIYSTSYIALDKSVVTQATAGVKAEGKGEVTTEKSSLAEPVAEAGKGKVSKIAESINAKAIEQGLTKGFGQLAEFTPMVIKEQAQISTDLINNNIDEARQMVRGEKALPDRLNGVSLIKAMEEVVKKTGDGELALELANSPLVSETSVAGQTLRAAAERDQESAVIAIEELKKVREKAKGFDIKKAKDRTVTEIDNSIKKAETEGFSKKQFSNKQTWVDFINSIRCP